MIRVFLDTNVVIDFLANREPFYDDIRQVLTKCKNESVKLYISALSFTTIYYVLRKQYEPQQLRVLLKDLRLLMMVASTDENIITNALNSDFSDFEDAVQYFTAEAVGADVILTRNKKDFKDTSIRVLTPSEFLVMF